VSGGNWCQGGNGCQFNVPPWEEIGVRRKLGSVWR
jgi:hypothetical protein